MSLLLGERDHFEWPLKDQVPRRDVLDRTHAFERRVDTQHPVKDTAPDDQVQVAPARDGCSVGVGSRGDPPPGDASHRVDADRAVGRLQTVDEVLPRGRVSVVGRERRPTVPLAVDGAELARPFAVAPQPAAVDVLANTLDGGPWHRRTHAAQSGIERAANAPDPGSATTSPSPAISSPRR